MLTVRKALGRFTGRHDEDGQAAISLVVILGLFAMGVLGFGVDLSNVWFHKQAARAAADAACQAGAIDMLAGASSSGPQMGFTAGTASNCVSTPAATMCSYANANGYNGSGLTAGADGGRTQSPSCPYPAQGRKWLNHRAELGVQNFASARSLARTSPTQPFG